jgi:surface polysaccharide O-acyltransferase-like enzyme
MISSESSLRLNLLRFPLIVGVVFIHASATKVGLSQPVFIVDFVRNFISSIAAVSVPTFFLMSGYLFFVKFSWSKQSYIAKLKTRVKTLLIPFLFWNTVAFIIVAIAQAIPATRVFFSGNRPPVSSFTSIFDYLNMLIGITGLPIADQFWFIRDLMILVLLVPFLSIIIRFLPLPFIGVMLACWLTGIWILYVPSSVAVLFFLLVLICHQSKKISSVPINLDQGFSYCISLL